MGFFPPGETDVRSQVLVAPELPRGVDLHSLQVRALQGDAHGVCHGVVSFLSTYNT